MVCGRCWTPEHSQTVGQRRGRGELYDQNEFNAIARRVFRRTLRNCQISSRAWCRCVEYLFLFLFLC